MTFFILYFWMGNAIRPSEESVCTWPIKHLIYNVKILPCVQTFLDSVKLIILIRDLTQRKCRTKHKSLEERLNDINWMWTISKNITWVWFDRTIKRFHTVMWKESWTVGPLGIMVQFAKYIIQAEKKNRYHGIWPFNYLIQSKLKITS